MTARDRFRQDVTDTLRDWRIGCIPPRWGDSTVFIFREGIADLARMRLWIAYMPLLQTLERISARVGVLADLKREPWAQSTHQINRR
jgi:hypothetical protein